MIEVASPEEMQAVGAALGRALAPGDIIGLVGELGAGKTVLVQGVASGLGVPSGVAVTSPTFTLVNEYRGGRLALFHVDLYRLEREAELEDIGLDDIFRQPAVVAVEWFDRFPDAVPADRLEIRIVVTSASRRRLEPTARGPRAARLIDAWQG